MSDAYTEQAITDIFIYHHLSSLIFSIKYTYLLLLAHIFNTYNKYYNKMEYLPFGFIQVDNI